jgi:hypothetical protein
MQLFWDPYAKEEFDRLAVRERALEIEQGSVLDPGGDGNSEDLDLRAYVNPEVPLRALERLIGCQGKILDRDIRALGDKAGRLCLGPPETPPLTSKRPGESSPSTAKGREKTLFKGIAP